MAVQHLVLQTRATANDANGNPLPGALVYTYETATTTPLATYPTAAAADAASGANANPIVADAAGRYGPLYTNGATGLKVVIKTAAGVTVDTIDPVPFTYDTSAAASSISLTPGAVLASSDVQSAFDALENVLTGQGDAIGLPDGSTTIPALYSATGGNTGVYFPSADTIGFVANGSERLRMTSLGALQYLQSSTSSPGAGNTTVGGAWATSGAIFASVSGTNAAGFNRNTSDGSLVACYRAGVSVGSISVTGSATAFNTSSDERLKENIAPADDPGAIIDAVQIRKFDFKANGDHIRWGVIAQDAYDHFPEMVKPGDDGETVNDPWQVDASKAVFLLWREVQLLRARVAALEAV